MSDELARVTDRLRQNRDARQSATDEGAANPRRSMNGALTALAPGDAVFDTSAGLDGVVLAAGARDGLRRNDVRVELVDGRVVLRDASTIVLRPRTPSAPEKGIR